MEMSTPAALVLMAARGKGQGCVESGNTLFSCSTDLNWHKLIMVRSLVVSCDPYLPRLDRIVDLGRGGTIMSNLQVRNKNVDGMQLP